MTGLMPAEIEAQAGFRQFVDDEVAPAADRNHRAQETPAETIRLLARRGYLGLTIPAELGGGGRDQVTLGLLAHELGRGCSSLRSLLTVHTMVGQAIARWGTRAQREAWLPRLASGEVIGALALTEPSAGSDAGAVETRAVADGGEFVLHGHKRWTTYGQTADLFLVFARSDAGPTAFLVERDRPGLRARPVVDLLGIRASMTADLRLEGCRVPADAVVGREGLGISHVAGVALDSGRYTVACGCAGIIDACLEASLAYTSERRQFGAAIKEHQLVRRMITDMMTSSRAARLLCVDAGRLRDARDPAALAATSIAKYFASTAAVRAASDAVQLHGANGCSADYPLQRYLGDAKVMEIIEGSTQIQQITIAEYGYQEENARPRKPAADRRDR
jgi:alkylation response protein AidB-like acyl-CoA dehydrogenase